MMIQVTTRATLAASQSTHVKELASELGRHVNYVYAMRGCGFKGGNLDEAIEWIAVTGFVIVKGKPVMKGKSV